MGSEEIFHRIYSGYQLSEIEPHPQPPPRKRGGGYDVLYSSAYRYTYYKFRQAIY